MNYPTYQDSILNLPRVQIPKVKDLVQMESDLVSDLIEMELIDFYQNFSPKIFEKREKKFAINNQV